MRKNQFISFQKEQVMGIPRNGGQCLAVIYSNTVELNTKLFTR